MKKSIFLLIIILFFQTCKPNSETEVSQPLLKSDTKNNIELTQIDPISRDSVNSFLEKPFDLSKFKEIKSSANSTGGIKKEYYKRPKTKGMYYQYFLFSNLRGYYGTNKNVKNRISRRENGLEITVYKKLGQYRHEYIDPTEEVIEIRAMMNDLDLPEFALIGLDSFSIIQKFGKPDLVYMNSIVYEHNNKALILKLNNKRVIWLKYISLKEGLDFTKNENIFVKKKNAW